MKRRGIKMQMIKNAKFLERIRKSVNNTIKRKILYIIKKVA